MFPAWLGLTAAAVARSPVKLILDTDMGGGACRDVDDVVALCTLHAMMDNGEVELLAVLQDTLPPLCAGAISVINHWYGRDGIPIGAYKGSGLTLAGNPPLTYIESLVRHFPSPIRNSSQVPDAVEVYRRVLAASPARSVTIASVGLQTNLELLLRSGPDAHSSLTGRELVAEKVLLLASMAGDYPRTVGENPQGTSWRECNACGCYNGADATSQATAAAASSYVAANTPPSVRTIYLGFSAGDIVRTGAVMQTCVAASSPNPCRHALLDFHAHAGWGWGTGGRSSYDPLTTLFAVRGLSVEGMGLGKCDDCDGINYIDPASGRNTWVAGPPSNQSYVVLKDRATAQAALDNLLCQPRLADLPSPTAPPAQPPAKPPVQSPLPLLPPPPLPPSSPPPSSVQSFTAGGKHKHKARWDCERRGEACNLHAHVSVATAAADANAAALPLPGKPSANLPLAVAGAVGLLLTLAVALSIAAIAVHLRTRCKRAFLRGKTKCAKTLVMTQDIHDSEWDEAEAEAEAEAYRSGVRPSRPASGRSKHELD